MKPVNTKERRRSYVTNGRIVQACRYVDCVVPQYDHDKFAAWERINFNVLFVGDDWYGSEIRINISRSLMASV